MDRNNPTCEVWYRHSPYCKEVLHRHLGDYAVSQVYVANVIHVSVVVIMVLAHREFIPFVFPFEPFLEHWIFR